MYRVGGHYIVYHIVSLVDNYSIVADCTGVVIGVSDCLDLSCLRRVELHQVQQCIVAGDHIT